MSEDLVEVDFQRFWRRLQQLGLNAYESRSYLVLLGHAKFKALELAARSHVPRQKIYEVLDSLVEKGFAQVVQEKTKLFSAVEPGLAIPAYLSRRRQILEQELMDNGRTGTALIDDLKALYSEGQGGRGTLDFLRIVTEPAQTARRIPPHAGRGEVRISRVFAAAVRRRSAGRKTGKAGCLGRRGLPLAPRSRHPRPGASPAPERIRGGGRGSPPSRFAAHEAGALRYPATA